MRKAGLVVFAMMIVGVFFLFVGCKGDDFGHNDDGVNNNAVSVYQGIVLEMKKDIKTYRDAADLGDPTADEAYYARTKTAGGHVPLAVHLLFSESYAMPNGDWAMAR